MLRLSVERSWVRLYIRFGHRSCTDFVTDNLELASLPTTTPEERKKLLSFVVCGGGPTGVEFAAELADMMAEDVLKYVSFAKGSVHPIAC